MFYLTFFHHMRGNVTLIRNLGSKIPQMSPLYSPVLHCADHIALHYFRAMLAREADREIRKLDQTLLGQQQEGEESRHVYTQLRPPHPATPAMQVPGSKLAKKSQRYMVAHITRGCEGNMMPPDVPDCFHQMSVYLSDIHTLSMCKTPCCQIRMTYRPDSERVTK